MLAVWAAIRPRSYVIVSPRIAQMFEQANLSSGVEVIVSEWLPDESTAYVYTPPPGVLPPGIGLS